MGSEMCIRDRDSPDHALRYLITPAMAERIRLRDGTCRHPGCSVPAKDCDVDHVIAFNKGDPELGGPTLEWNLVCLCRKHHREKTFGTNTYRTGPLGELIICTDTGHEHRTRPKGPLARAATPSENASGRPSPTASSPTTAPSSTHQATPDTAPTPDPPDAQPRLKHRPA